MARRPMLVVALLVAGTLCLQAAWILAIQPFRGLDEWDHVYRAGSVAQGHWLAEDSPPGKTHGYLIPTPRELVTAATPICIQYPYVSADNCMPVRELGDGMVAVSSGAARYNPVFYAVIGIPTSNLQGVTAVYGMRVLSALLCSALIGLAAYSLLLWARTIWPVVALTLCLTPTSLYSMSLPAPNGVEMAAGLSLWASLLGLSKAEDARVRPLLMIATASALPLATVRALGPLWLALVVASAMLVMPRRQIARLWLAHRPIVLLFLSVGTAAVLLSAAWSHVARTNPIALTVPRGQVSVPELAAQVVVWVFQSVGAFPGRSDPAPLRVYAVYFTLVGLFLIAATALANTAIRRAALFVIMTALGTSVVVTLVTYPTAAFIWQGRYALPLTYGVLMIAGLTLDNSMFSPRFMRGLLFTGFIGLGGAHAMSSVAALRRLKAKEVPGGDPHWVAAPAWIIALLCLVGTLMWLGALYRARKYSTPAPPSVGDSAISAPPNQ